MRKRKLNPNIIRVGDKVKIINPEFFLRCGYDNNHKGACEIIDKTYKHQINRFIYIWEQSLMKRKTGSIPLCKLICENSSIYLKIASALAYDLVNKNMKEGVERKIYTERVDFYRSNIFFVSSIEYVRTGIYHLPYGGYNNGTEEYDYKPGYLDRPVVRKILYFNEFLYGLSGDKTAIEDCNVEKIP